MLEKSKQVLEEMSKASHSPQSGVEPQLPLIAALKVLFQQKVIDREAATGRL